MGKKLCILLALLISTLAFSQQAKIDSLKIKLNNTTNSDLKLKILDSLSLELYNNQQNPKSLEFFMQLLEIAKKKSNKKSQMNAYSYIIDYYIKREDETLAEKYGLEAFYLNKPKNNLEGYLRGCNDLGRVYDHFKKYELAIKIYNDGIDAYSEKPGSAVIITIYNNLGQAYGRLGKPNAETEAHIKAAEYADMFHDYDKKSFTLYNLGWNYMSLGQYEKAEKYYLRGLKDSSKIKLLEYKYTIHHALGINYSRWGKYRKALIHNELALNYFKNIGYRLYEFDILNNIAAVYSRMKDYTQTIEFGKKALKVAKELNHPLAISGAKQTLATAYLNIAQFSQAEKLLLEIAKDTTNSNIIGIDSKMALYANLSDLYKNKRDYKKAYLYHKQFKKLSDSTLMASRDSKFAEIETKYETEKKEKENLALKQQNAQQALLTEKEKTQKWAIGGGLAVSLAGLGFFFVAYNKNQKQKKEIEKQKNLVEGLQRELHHRLKNNLSFIDFFITLAKGKFPDPAYRQKLDELQNRINSMFEVHKQLFKKEDITMVNAKTYISALVDNVKNAYDTESIAIRENVPDTTLRADISFPIGLIVNEFVTNSFKYAFPENGKGIISIELNEDPENYNLKLSDNGKGLPTDFDINKLNSFGIETIKLLTQEYKGTFALDGSDGTKMEITFSKNVA